MSRVRKAVVPVAGLGTRLFPASHAVKKELFPVVGPDGVARALLHYHLLELESAGFEEICIIIQPGEEAAIRAYLGGPDDAYVKRLEQYPALHAEALRMRGLSKRVRFAVQKTQDGYGHAVFQSREFVGDEPCLLCLGDHLFRGAPEKRGERSAERGGPEIPTLAARDESRGGSVMGAGERISGTQHSALSTPRSTSPYAEIAATWPRSSGRSVSAVNRISPQQLKGYGTIAGKRRTDDPRLIDVSLIIEKPTVDIARAKLRVDGLGSDEFLGWFGMHLLAPSIFDVLAQMIRDDVRDGGEFQLTRAQEFQRQREGYLALEMTGARRFDFGTPADFVTAVQEFARAE